MHNKKNRLAAGLLGLTLSVGLFAAGCESTTKSTTEAKKTAGGESCGECCDVAVPVSAPSTAPTTAPTAAVPATQPATQPATAGEWKNLFDGKSLDGWKSSGFAGQGEPEVADGILTLPVGEGLTGITFAGGELPKANYEVEVVAKRVDGGDFFCGITFPVNNSHATFVLGGWGGAVVGVSSINDSDAAHNETTTYQKFEKNRFYTARVRVLPERIEAWIDDKQVVNADIKGKKVDIRSGIEEAKPLGVSAWQTTSAIKSIKMRTIEAK